MEKERKEHVNVILFNSTLYSDIVIRLQNCFPSRWNSVTKIFSKKASMTEMKTIFGVVLQTFNFNIPEEIFLN